MKAGFQIVLGMVVGSAFILATGCQKKSNVSTVAATPQANKVSLSAQVQPAQAQPPQPQPVKQSVKPADEKPSSVKMEKLEHNFGSIGPNSDNKCQFKFSNVGKGILKIDHIQSTCGCTVPELIKKEYAPGEAGAIDVAFRAPGYPGVVTKHLYVVSNDPVAPRVELAIKATVEVKVVVDPNNIELSINKENCGMVPIKVKSIDNVPFAIISFTATGQSMSCQFDPKEKKTEHILTPKVDISKIQEMNTGIIQIGVDHPQLKEVTVGYNALPMFELRPSRIILQNAEPGVVTKREVWIVSNYGRAFEIESIKSRNDYMKVVSQKKDGNNIGLEVEITSPKQQGPMRRYITDELSIKIKDGPMLTVRCSGWFKL
jgi:hypothetical protein